MKVYKKLLVVLLFSVFQAVACHAAGFVIDHNSTDLSQIPDQYIDAAKRDLFIVYNHTSHGSQLITGMNALEDFPVFSGKYNWVNSETGQTDNLNLRDGGIPGQADLSKGDLDSDNDGIADWAEDTYEYLTLKENNGDYVHANINVVLWSWCDIGGHDIPRYLQSMEWLITQFSEGGTDPRASLHPVQFVFMTGHANGGGEGDSSDSRNQIIRQHVQDNDRILFDFSDIENYDPDNNYFLDKLLQDDLDYDSDGNGSVDANWASEYLERHPGSELDQLTHGEGVVGYDGCERCAHSEGPDLDARLNCVLKGRAAWALFARLAGWSECTQAPSSLAAVVDDQDQEHINVNLSWTDNASDEDSYTVERRVAGGTWTTLISMPADSETFVDKDLTRGSYQYRVLAHKGVGTQDPCYAASNMIDVEISGPALPQSPRSLKVEIPN